MAGGVPILGEDDVLEVPGQLADDGNDCVTVGNCECAASSVDCRAEVVLDVDDKKGVGSLHLHQPQFVTGNGYQNGIAP